MTHDADSRVDEADAVADALTMNRARVGRMLPLLALIGVLSVIGALILFFVQFFKEGTYAAQSKCEAATMLTAAHLSRSTQTASNSLRSIDVWLRGQEADYMQNEVLYQIGSALNIDPEQTSAFAIIDMEGKAWLLDERNKGKIFDVSHRPYFSVGKSAPSGSIVYGPRVTNANTGSDTVAVMLKSSNRNKGVILSTAIGMKGVDAFIKSVVGDSGGHLQIMNADKKVSESGVVVADNVYEKLRAGPTSDKVFYGRQVGMLTYGCVRTVAQLPFHIEAVFPASGLFKNWGGFVVALPILIIISVLLISLSYVLIARLYRQLRLNQTALLTALDTANQASKSKSDFLASMSHELRTPMNAVLGFAQMLQYITKSPLNSAQKEYVENIIAGGNHLLKLINDILDLSVIEADKAKYFVEDVNTQEITTECLRLMVHVGETRRIKIIDELINTPEVIIQTDRMRFKQVVLNLLSNAIKYNKEGGEITLSGETAEGFQRISVADSGYGISKDDQSNVFQMFSRAGLEPMLAREGTGIGLTVSKLLVERLGGRIGFTSEKNVGSTFWIELPLATNTEVLIWNENLRVNVDAIDSDHQILFSLINRISDSDGKVTNFDTAIKDVIEFFQHHFQREETIMEICDYPDLESHRQTHRSLNQDLTNHYDMYRKNPGPESRHKIRVFLRVWWITHIVEADTKIAPYAEGKANEIRKALEGIK